MVPRAKAGVSNRPKVLVVAHRIDRSGQGMERLHARLAEMLSTDFEVHVLVGAIDPDTATSVTVHKVPLIERPIPLRFMMFAILGTLRIVLLRRRMDVLHSCGAIVFNRMDLISVHLCQAAVVHANGDRVMPTTGSVLRRVNTAALKAMALNMERLAFRRATTTAAAVSERGLEELATFYPNTPRVLTENGVDGEVFFPDGARRSTIREELGVNEDAFVALLVGGDWTLRGVELAISALQELPREVVLYIAGRGDLERMEGLATSLGVASRVRFLGVRRDLPDLYRAADVLVQMSAYETFSLVLVEAALSHLPLISTNVGIAPTLCGADHSGGVLIERSSAALSEAISHVMENQDMSRHRAALALQRAQRFTLSHLAIQVGEVYENLAGAS